jgi:hypothetical protein
VDGLSFERVAGSYHITCFKDSVQGVVALGRHMAKLCQELDFYEAFFFIINFQNEKANTFNHSYSEKSSNRAT